MRLRSLFNLLAGREQNARWTPEDRSQANQLLNFGKPLPEGLDPRSVMETLMQSPDSRTRYFGYDPLDKVFSRRDKQAKPDQDNNKIDRLFRDKLL